MEATYNSKFDVPTKTTVTLFKGCFILTEFEPVSGSVRLRSTVARKDLNNLVKTFNETNIDLLTVSATDDQLNIFAKDRLTNKLKQWTARVIDNSTLLISRELPLDTLGITSMACSDSLFKTDQVLCVLAGYANKAIIVKSNGFEEVLELQPYKGVIGRQVTVSGDGK